MRLDILIKTKIKGKVESQRRFLSSLIKAGSLLVGRRYNTHRVGST